MADITKIVITFDKVNRKYIPSNVEVTHEGNYDITHYEDISAWDVAPELKQFIEALEPHLKES